MPSLSGAVEGSRGACLLLVDDTPENIEILVALLRSDYDLKTADRGEAALKICEENGGIDLILLDVTMPGMDGFEVCRILRRQPRTREIPILFLTGRTEVDDVVQGFEAGGSDYLTKPFRAEELLARVRTHLTLRAQQLEIAQQKAAMEDDLNMAREVQIAFLPQQFPSFPRRAPPEESALGFCARYLPATMVGGDFFYVIPISDACAGVLICDVMGHGVQAALVTAIQRALVEELSELAGDPGAFFTELNRALLSILRRTRSPMFASAFYLTIDVESGLLRYVNAGHPSPLHLGRSNGTVHRLEEKHGRRGPALGVFDGCVYGVQEKRIAEGDLVVLFTDGLYEVESSSGEPYEQARLLEAIQARSHRPTCEILDETIAEVRAFSAMNSFSDDVCLVGVDALRVAATAAEAAVRPD